MCAMEIKFDLNEVIEDAKTFSPPSTPVEVVSDPPPLVPVDIPQEAITYEGTRAIPEDLNDVLFFMYMNGMTYAQIVEHYKDSEHPFNLRQIKKYSEKNRWAKRRRDVEEEVQREFSGIIKMCQAKKVAAISMAVQTVSDMIIKDVNDLRTDPISFWREVAERARPKPFWLAKNIDELTSLYKLQKFLEDDGRDDKGDEIPQSERSILLRALADSRALPPQPANIQIEDRSIEAELIEAPNGNSEHKDD